MQISVTFKNLDPSQHLKDYVKNKLDKLDKLTDNPAEANVVLSVEKIRHIAEIKITGDRLNVNCREKTNDMYSSIDMALTKREKQRKKNKQKGRKRRHDHKPNLIGKSQTDELIDDNDDNRITIHNIEYKPMDIEEASMQMELLTDNFFVFTNSQTNKVNVLYRRKNGDLGLIQPVS